MVASSTKTTAIATVIATLMLCMRNGNVWPMPPSAVIAPQTEPRSHGVPRPVRLPSSERASAKPMLMPAPSDAARPTAKASQVFLVATAAAKTGASVETEPSIKPARPGCTICKTKRRRLALSSSSRTSGLSSVFSSSAARSTWVASSAARSSSNWRMLASCARAAARAQDASIRQLLDDLAAEEATHVERAAELEKTELKPEIREEEDKAKRRLFVLQIVQPGLAGLMDGSVSTLAPVFAAAFATKNTWDAFAVGLAASLGAGISMGFAEA